MSIDGRGWGGRGAGPHVGEAQARHSVWWEDGRVQRGWSKCGRGYRGATETAWRRRLVGQRVVSWLAPPPPLRWAGDVDGAADSELAPTTPCHASVCDGRPGGGMRAGAGTEVTPPRDFARTETTDDARTRHAGLVDAARWQAGWADPGYVNLFCPRNDNWALRSSIIAPQFFFLLPSFLVSQTKKKSSFFLSSVKLVCIKQTLLRFGNLCF